MPKDCSRDDRGNVRVIAGGFGVRVGFYPILYGSLWCFASSGGQDCGAQDTKMCSDIGETLPYAMHSLAGRTAETRGTATKNFHETWVDNTDLAPATCEQTLQSDVASRHSGGTTTLVLSKWNTVRTGRGTGSGRGSFRSLAVR